jgi:hypothetical protein
LLICRGRSSASQARRRGSDVACSYLVRVEAAMGMVGDALSHAHTKWNCHHIALGNPYQQQQTGPALYKSSCGFETKTELEIF